MFGGLAFLVGGNMAIAASSEAVCSSGSIPRKSERLLGATTDAVPMEMRGREMHGWLRVESGDVTAKDQLAEWVARGTAYARSLPAKR